MSDVLTNRAPGRRIPAERPGETDRAPTGVLAGSVADGLAVVVAPSTGRFQPGRAIAAVLRAGEVLGHITGGRGRADEVCTPVAAELRELLVRPGQLVSRGQGLAWLQRVPREQS